MTASRPGVRRVLLTADPIGGVWPFALELARALSRSGIEVVLAVLGGRLGSGQRRDAAAAGVAQLREGPWRLEWMPDPWSDVEAAAEWLLQVERDTAPDVVHLNQLTFGALPWQAPAVVTVHSCVLSWWRAVHGCDAPAEWSRYRDTVTASLRAATLVLAPSRAMLSVAEGLYGPLGATRVIPNARDPQQFAPGRKADLILAAGRCWDEAKNLATLSRIAASLPWPVYLAGDVRHPDGTLRPPSDVRLLGQVAPRQMAWWLGRAAVFAHPARYEPFGLAPLEAALSGCALVLGDIQSLRELWQDVALFVPPCDGEQLRRTLRRLAFDADIRERLGTMARRRALQFSPDRFGSAHRDAYRQALEFNPVVREQAACA
jgi:glycosyltransferase involved in cell wall biosynthesis